MNSAFFCIPFNLQQTHWLYILLQYTPFDESGAEVDAATGHDAEAGGEAEPTLPLTDDDNSNSSQ